jgi:fumarate reductase subunit C
MMSRRKPYVRSMAGWWRRDPHFTRYMLREGTSIFLALYAGILLLGLVALANGESAYNAWLEFVRHPFSVLLHVIVLASAAFHTVTWFTVSPKAMPVLRAAGKPIPPGFIVASQYAAAAVASIAVLLLALVP